MFTVLRSALKMATDRGRLLRNPASLVEHRSPRTPEVDPLTADEIAKIVAACDTSTESARWLVGLALGLRQGEALGLQWGDIDFSSGCIRIRRQWLRKTYRHGCVELAGCKSAAACPCRVVNPRVGVLKSTAGRRDGSHLPSSTPSSKSTRRPRPRVVSVVRQRSCRTSGF